MSGFGSRLLVGAIAGFVATAAMTAAMRRLHRRLPERERYPLPPREIEERTQGATDESTAGNLTLLSHFAFGAGAGAAMTAPKIPGPLLGSALGVLVWLGSYMGWVPASRILRPATTHPLRRNLLMIAVHLVWGSVTAATAKDLDEARKSIFANGEMRDAPERLGR
jgi:uncharacterized membrane protein YagU involved in acid resistance